MVKKYVMFLYLILVLTFYGCGGGGDDGIDTFGSGGGGGNYYVSIAGYDLNPKTITQGSAVEVSWNVNYRGVAGFWVELHMNSSNTIPEGMSSLTKLFHFNCEMGPFTCSKSASAVCEVKKDTTSGKLYAQCRPTWDTSGNPQTQYFVFSGSGYAILRACTFDGTMKTICDQKAIQVTVQ